MSLESGLSRSSRGDSRLSPTTNELQTSALFVKGRAVAPNGDLLGHFHLQITATGGGSTVGSEDELFRKVPDVDFYDQLRTSTDTQVAIAIRGIGEIAAADFNNLAAHPSRVDLDSATDEYGVRRATVTLTATQRDNDLWTAMDAAMTQVMNVFANGQPIQLIQANASGGPAHDGLGTTHHETGTLWMGTDSTKSVTDPDGRFHHTENLYAAGPCLFPSIGSPNPMLTGIAVARRTGDQIITPAALSPIPVLKRSSTAKHLATGECPRSATNRGATIRAFFSFAAAPSRLIPARILGMLWLNRPSPPRYVLRLEWMMTAPDDNSGVFVAFPDPEQQNYDNTAYVGINFGFEIQIDDWHDRTTR